MQNTMTALVKELFEKLNIKIDSVEINNKDVEENIFIIKIKSEESSIIIGANGKNLDAIQNILKLMLSKIIGKTIKLNVEINDYVKSKDDRLFDFIQKEISYLEKTGKDIQLPYFSSHERKKIHSIVHKLKNNMIFTKSVGEGKERRLYICKNSPKLTIDIDGNDI